MSLTRQQYNFSYKIFFILTFIQKLLNLPSITYILQNIFFNSNFVLHSFFFIKHTIIQNNFSHSIALYNSGIKLLPFATQKLNYFIFNLLLIPRSVTWFIYVPCFFFFALRRKLWSLVHPQHCHYFKSTYYYKGMIQNHTAYDTWYKNGYKNNTSFFFLNEKHAL